MNLENTKVYTKDPEVIRKYAELCGVELIMDDDLYENVAGYYCNDFENHGRKSVECFLVNGQIDRDREVITTDQINIMHAEKFGVMAQDNEQLQNYEMGERVEWKNGDLCVFKGEAAVVIGWHPAHPVLVIDSDAKGFIGITDLSLLSKPETPQQREERERLEAAIELHDLAQDVYFACDGGSDGSAIWDKAPERVKSTYLAIVDKTGYRKQKDGE